MKIFFACFALCFCQCLASGSAFAGLTKPFFTSKEVTRVSAGSEYYYQFAAADSAGSSIGFSVQTLPAWMKFDPVHHSISGTPGRAGQFAVSIVAYNDADSVSQRFMVTAFNRKTVNILPLGNSITNGTDVFDSYRRPLWKLLHDAQLNFDLIGSWSKHHMGTEVPDPDFDMDHEGHSGWTAANVFDPPAWDSSRRDIEKWLKAYTPDIVLVELGTNDVFQCRKPKDVIRDLSKVITVLRTKNPGVKVFISQLPPFGAKWANQKLCGNDTTYDQTIRIVNKLIVELCNTTGNKKSAVIAVDQYTGIDPSVNMYDDIHPNTSGEAIMASRWFEAIKKDLPKL